MQWSDINWQKLEKLRGNFLNPQEGDYWDRELLQAYDLTFGERIGWKWEAVLKELKSRGWAHTSKWRVLDWGCGTGRAARSYLSHFPQASGVELVDRSPLAVAFAREQLLARFPSVRQASDGPHVLLLSHVLNEQNDDNWKALLDRVLEADAVVWVEPGTRDHSARLLEARERLRGHFHIVAPCPHQSACGILTSDGKSWCHNFAPVSTPVFHDPRWSEFSRRLGIDLRSLPVSFLALQRGPKQSTGFSPARLLGRPKKLKGAVRAVVCDETGVRQRQIRMKSAKALGLTKKIEFYKPLESLE